MPSSADPLAARLRHAKVVAGRIFRRDEDFARTLRTLERLVALDFDVLFCAHRPRLTGGRDAMRTKLDWLRRVEGRARALDAEGLPIDEIVKRLGLGASRPFYRLTFGDVSTRNMVRSILVGPSPRAEFRDEELSHPRCGERRAPFRSSRSLARFTSRAAIRRRSR